MYLQAGLLTPPPKMLEAAEFFFTAMWCKDILKFVTKKRTIRVVRIKKLQKMRQESKQSFEKASRAIRSDKSFDVIVYKTRGDSQISRTVQSYIFGEDVGSSYDPGPGWVLKGGSKWDYWSSKEDMNGALKEGLLESLSLVDWKIEQAEKRLEAIDGFRATLKQTIQKAKTPAMRLLGGLKPKTTVKMDLSGWALWERRAGKEAKLLEAIYKQNFPQPLTLEYAPTSDDDWGLFYGGSEWKLLVRMHDFQKTISREGYADQDVFDKKLRELKRTTAHEMGHYAQFALKRLLDLKEIAGVPTDISDRSKVDAQGSPIDEAGKAQHSEWDPESRTWVDKRIPHELRDVEFEPRLRDAVSRFMWNFAEIEEQVDNPLSGRFKGWGEWDHPYTTVKPFIETFLDIKKHTSPDYNQIGRAEWSAYHWFEYLKKHDRKRYNHALKKFMAEITQRGVTKKIPLKPARKRFPMKEPNHDAWGKVVTEYTQDNSKLQYNRDVSEEAKYKENVKHLKEYQKFVGSLTLEQLRRHKDIATTKRNSKGKEYWVTPRWQKHMKKPLTSDQMEAMRANAPDHPLLRRNR